MNRCNNALVTVALAVVVFCDRAHAAASPPLQAKFLGQLQPQGLPAGIPFGGGGNVFERRVDVSGSLAVVGAGLFRRGEDDGYAFVFDFSDPTNIRQIATLRPSDNRAGNEFGDGVAISGNQVFVTAWGDREDRGAVYMYDVSDPDNIVERKIRAFDEAPNNAFGFSLSANGNRLLIGAPKFSAFSTTPAAAYLIDFSNPNSIQQTKINPGFPGLGSGYGTAVALSGNYAIVSRSSESTPHPFAGAAYLYDLTNPSAIRSKRLAPTDAPNYRSFGDRVAISGTTALVSVASDPGPDNPPGASDGAVWAFDFSNWNSVKQHEYGATLAPFDTPFGRFLDLQGNLAVGGAFNADNGRGAVFLHDVSNVLAPQQLLRLPSHAADDQGFGVSVAIDGDKLIVSDQAGDVYLYQLIPEPSAGALAMFALSAGELLRRRRPQAVAASEKRKDVRNS